MAKNFRKKRAAALKKEARKNNMSLISSSGRESGHYIAQSICRSGFFKLIRRKVTKKEIKNRHIMIKKLTRGRFLVTNYRTGDKLVVSKNLKAGITFLNTS